MRILFCGNNFPDAPEYLRKHLPPGCNDEIVVCSETDVLPQLGRADVVIPKMLRMGRREMEAGQFRLIQQWGAGLEGIDLESAKQKGVYVANVPATGGNAESVAEHALLLILALLRDLPKADANVRAGVLGAPLGKMLAGRTVCLYGLGAIALPIAKRLHSFEVDLIGITRDPTAAKVSEFGLSRCFSQEERERAFAETDILVLCMRYTEDMRGMIGARELAGLRRGAYLINMARGGLIDQEALYAQLASGHLAGAGLDVFWQEPLPTNDPILTLPNVIATPHVGGVTEASFEEIAKAVAENIERLRRGESPLHAAF
ncbi:D-isomer specific 2-hydroxyacid dehydrogenase NAD-binding protein [Terriglobus saanensis SP1PR4]|uniref:D-isomer specific 2-hydroxyacid dehydrogenase NAD-binding protein n=1 Tax=Terriglobus saanensis (strain ATCC BAA-1853 / DSM 23119 / SP1PR4) TaxID=401053 RepID=E8V5F2_TERSS|nr:D-isomer specific 2-hydroxyacid dehydrogenase NAD-binding protein [Terriglobus saanensis SP1PR4]